MKITVVGMGNVGAATAHALMTAGLANDLVLVSRDERKAAGHALDIQHASAMLPFVAHVRGGGIGLSEKSDVVILTHSVPTVEYGRKKLAAGNAELFRETVPRYIELSPDAAFVVLTNPVDALTWLTIELTRLNPTRVIGSGSIIDSIRLRTLLSAHYRIHPDDLRVYVLGEHGEHQFPAVSLSAAGGVRLRDLELVQRLFEQARDSAFEVFENKGHTNIAIAHVAVMITRSIVYNEHHTLPISTKLSGFLGEEDVCLSLPCVVGKNGVERVLYPDLPEEETAAFKAGAASVRETIAMMA
ncbi:MAG: lactate dehydrogenase [Planctomycetota bacterium]